MKKGKLIAIDGMDGVGKSTLSKSLAENRINTKCNDTFGDRFIIRELEAVSSKLKLNKYQAFSDRIINLAWMSDLVETAINTINPLLESGYDVVLDRYILSAKVYSMATANDDFTKFFPLYNLIPQPDLCIFLYADVETALDRISKRNIPKTFYETYDGLTAITNRYKEYIKYESYPIITIQSNKQSKDVLLEVSGLIDQKFNVEDMKKPV